MIVLCRDDDALSRSDVITVSLHSFLGCSIDTVVFQDMQIDSGGSRYGE